MQILIFITTLISMQLFICIKLRQAFCNVSSRNNTPHNPNNTIFNCNFCLIECYNFENKSQNISVDGNLNYTDTVIVYDLTGYGSQAILINATNIYFNQVIIKFDLDISDKDKKDLDHNLTLYGQEVQINATNIIIDFQLQIIATQNLSIQNSIVQAKKIGLFGIFTTYKNTSIQSTSNHCKVQCSCNTYGNCSDLVGSTLQPFTTLIRQYSTLVQKQFYTMDKFDRTYISQTFDNPIDLLNEMLNINFTFISIAQNMTTFHESLIVSSHIGIYSYNSVINYSNISSKGLGCQLSEGLGCGFLDWIIGLRLQCGGTGASHGGRGGFCTSQSANYQQKCLQMRSRPIYDSQFNPIYEGSGGGGTVQQEDFTVPRGGGGVVYYENYDTILFQNASINSDGSSAKNQNYGSGSGGTVQIGTVYIKGIGNVSANGGDQFVKNSYGGAGGGGRIKLTIFNFYNQTDENQDSEVNFTTLFGFLNTQTQLKLKSNAEVYPNWNIPYQGSIIGSPCKQGYGTNVGTFVCSQCQNGYYAMLLNSQDCKTCINQDDNTIYNTNNSISPFCQPIGCFSGYTFYDKKICITEFQAFKQSIGGEDGLLALGIALSLLVINVIVVVIKRQKRLKKKGSSINRRSSSGYINSDLDDDKIDLIQLRDQSSAKPHFIGADLPYHVKRIYLNGFNSYNQPWVIYAETFKEFPQETQNKIAELFDNFNRNAAYNGCEKALLIFFRFYYFPIYTFIQTELQKKKYKTLKKILMKDKIDILNSNSTGSFFKFSHSQDYTLGYIDVLNYNQDALSWSNATTFPVSLVLSGQGTFMFPLFIDKKDPIITLLWLTLDKLNQQPSDNSDSSDEEKPSELEIFLENFNYYAKLIDFRQSASSFSKRFRDLVSYTNSINKTKFRALKVQVDICVHIMAKNSQDKSKLIMLGLENYKDLEKCFSDIYHLQNFSNQQYIKFSVNFDSNKSESFYEDQVIIDTSNNINAQIGTYKDYEDERELPNNLRQKMKRRLDFYEVSDEDGKLLVQSYKNFDNYASFYNQRVKQAQESFLVHIKMVLLTIKKYLAWTLSQFTRQRVTKIEQRILLLLMCCVLLFCWGFSIVYPIILIEQYEGNSNHIIEMVMQSIIFPCSQLISPLLLSIWLLNSNNYIGRFYLLFNFCGVISSFIEFIFGITEMFIRLQDSLNSEVGKLLNLIKIFQFFVMIISSYLGCLQLNQNERILLKQ
ncbi:hypothetical protein pb186bvf_004295 [Paramecium bursaria]